jgi:hypothetical protein
MTTVERTRTSLRRRSVLAMVVSAIGLAGAAQAQAAANLVDLTVVDRDTGQPLQVWRHDGRLFIAGEPGARYSLRVTNHTDGRVLVVMSVDGVNILTGETADYGQRGYVFGPHQSYDVSGWRKSDTEVAAFTFASLSRSYAARTGRPGDVGVIGLAAFKERVIVQQSVAPAPRARAHSRNDSEADIPERVVTGRRAASSPAAAPPPPRMAPSARLAAPERSVAPSEPSDVAVTAQRREEKLGTAHGAREWSVATTVPFERATRYPQLIRRIEYDTYERLAAIGVVRPPWEPAHRPRPFPGSGAGYVPDPPDWP